MVLQKQWKFNQTDTPIAGFQFNVSGIVITDASGGEAGKAGFMMSNSATTALGFSLSGTTIFVGKGKLLEIGYVENEPAGDDDAAVAPFDCASAVANFGCDFNWGGITISEACPESCGTKTYGINTICLRDVIVSGPTGKDMGFQAGRCWVP